MYGSLVLRRAMVLQLASVLGATVLAAQQRVNIERSKLGTLIKRQVPVSVVGSSGTDTIADTGRVSLMRDQYLAAVVGDRTQIDTASGGHVDLPIRYVRTDASGERAEFHLTPAVEVEGGGLGYRPDGDLFRGSVLIGVEDSVRPSSRRSLDPPIRLQLTTDAGSIEPSQLELRATNIPFVRVLLETPASAGDSLTVHVRPEFTREPVNFRVALLRPALRLEPSPRRILGFGLEVARLTAILPPGATRAARTVVFESDRGAAEPATVTVRDEGTAGAALRSRGVGRATVAVHSPPLGSGTAQVVFEWPVTFLVASLLGAALGDAVAWGRGRRSGTRRSAGRRGAELLSGFLVGLLTAVGYAAGVNLTGLEIKTQYGEGLAFVLAALGSIYGLPGLSRALPVIRRLSGASPRPQ